MTPLPKRRHSTYRQGKRRGAIKLATPVLVRCPHCGQTKIYHQLCPVCGNYSLNNEKPTGSQT